MKKTVLFVIIVTVIAALPVSAVDFRITAGESMGIPFWVSADLGVVMGRELGSRFTGVKVSGEIGVGGTKGFIGYYSAIRSRFVATSFTVGPAFMRTFGSPLLADDWRSYLGIEAQFSIAAFLPITLRLGAYSWISEFHPQFTFGFGIGI